MELYITQMLPLSLVCQECYRSYTVGCVRRIGDDHYCPKCNPFIFEEEDEDGKENTDA